MKAEQVKQILTQISENDSKCEIGIMLNNGRVERMDSEDMQAAIQNDILLIETDKGTMWIDCQSIVEIFI